VSDPAMSDRLLGERTLPARGGRSAPADAGLSAEVAELAALLAQVVVLAADRAVFPSRLQVVAELAREHDSVCGALAAEGTGS
jgi:hypothetical protein